MKSRWTGSLVIIVVALLIIFLSFGVWINKQENAEKRISRRYLHKDHIAFRILDDISEETQSFGDLLSEDTYILTLHNSGFKIVAINGKTDFDLISGDQLHGEELIEKKEFFYSGKDADVTGKEQKKGILGIDLPSGLDIFVITAQQTATLPAGNYFLDGSGLVEESMSSIKAAFGDNIERNDANRITPLRETQILSVSIYSVVAMPFIAFLGFLLCVSYWLDSQGQLMNVLWFIGIVKNRRELHIFFRGVPLISSGISFGLIISLSIFPGQAVSVLISSLLFCALACSILSVEIHLRDYGLSIEKVR